MLFLTYSDYRLEFLEADKFLNITADRLGKKKKLKNNIKMQLIWSDASFDYLKLYYNFLLIYFFFENVCYLNTIKYGRLDKQSFFILKFNFNVKDYSFLNFFFFDFLRFYFFSKDNIFGQKYYKIKVEKGFLFFRLLNFDLFFNKRLSEKMPIFFPRISYPLNIYITYSNINLIKNKVFLYLLK